MSEHPTAAELEGLVRGDLTRDQARLVVRHLLRGCESCVAFIAPYASMLIDAVDRSGRPQPVRVFTPLTPPTPVAPAGESGAAAGSPSRFARRVRPDGATDTPDAAVAAVSAPPSLSSSRPAQAPDARQPVGGGGAAGSQAAPAPTGSQGSTEEPDRTLVENAYDRAIDRAFAAVMQHGEKAARSSAKVHEALAQLGGEGLDGLRELPADLCGFAGYEALLERSWAMRREEPKQMVKL